ncbi:MAG: glycosyltransferase [Candidatus Firestonebacteria bacterium]
MKANLSLVSVVITTRNEEKNIENCLQSIKIQTYPQELIEIIVVDNNSTDKTKEITLKYTNLILTKGPERSVQRNFGIQNAKGVYILYLDADMILNEKVIEECVNKCEKENLIALYIPERIVGKGFWIKVRDFERTFYNATCIDGVRFVRRDKFFEIKGFDETLTGPEDWDFDRRIKTLGNVGVIDSNISHNEGDFNFRRYITKKSYYAKSFDKYIEKWGKQDVIIKKQFGIWYRFFGVFLEKKEKVFKLILHPVLTFSMFFLRIMVGMIYIKDKIYDGNK